MAGTAEYYEKWARYVEEGNDIGCARGEGTATIAASGKEVDSAPESGKDEAETAEPLLAKVEATPVVPAERPAPTRSGLGFEFRTGKQTHFPEVKRVEDETEEAAALRVASERREMGIKVFSDGSVWGAQQAVDIWGQGLLAIERAKNLRKYRKARQEAGTATPEDIAVQELEDADDAAAAEACAEAGDNALDSSVPDIFPMAVDAAHLPRRVPTEQQVASLQFTIRLNIAQALLKLNDYEKCINFCDGALDLNPNSTKALWRKAKAVWGTRNPGLARQTLDRLLVLEPHNAAAKAMLLEIEGEEARKRARRLGAPGRKAAAAAKSIRSDGVVAAALEREFVTKDAPKQLVTASVLEASRLRWCCCRRKVKTA
mmetsp:Transcript_59377/g.165800  ORF Transcript_59377/g.165800 Transcript_59377/m.165800 type:complete len:373 (-) Transcript_59377:64-1182(-)